MLIGILVSVVTCALIIVISGGILFGVWCRRRWGYERVQGANDQQRVDNGNEGGGDNQNGREN